MIRCNSDLANWQPPSRNKCQFFSDKTYISQTCHRWLSDHITPVLYASSIGYPPRECQVQSGMSGSPFAVQTGASVLGRRLLPRVRQGSELSAVSWRSNLHGAANTQQLRRKNFCSCWTSLVELSSGPVAQSIHHLWTVQTTAEGTSLSESMNTALCDFWYATP